MDNYQKWKMHLMTTPIDEHLSVQKANQIKVKTKGREKTDNVLLRIARIGSHTCNYSSKGTKKHIFVLIQLTELLRQVKF